MPTQHKHTSKKEHNRKVKILGSLYKPACKILILFGVAILLMAGVVIWQHNASTKRTERTTGKVTEVNKVSGIGRDEKGNSAQKCQIRYEINVDGQVYTSVMGYHGEPTPDKCQLAVGSSIEVDYDHRRPANNSYHQDTIESKHQTLSDVLQSAIGIGIVGIIPIVIGILGLAAARHDIDPDAVADNVINKLEGIDSIPEAKVVKKK